MDNFARVSDDDPRRCQAVTANGQCKLKAVEEGKMCICHGGASTQEAKIKESLRNYRLTKFKAQLEHFADNRNIKSLRDEIGILRMTLEERLNMCEDTKDLIYQSGPISDLVLKIERVVASCHKLELATGQLLDKQSILNFGGELIGIISDVVEDDETLGRLSNRILTLITRTFTEDAQA